MKKNTSLAASNNLTDWVKLRDMDDADIVYDEDAPETSAMDWEGAIVSHGLVDLRKKLAQKRGRPVVSNPKVSTTMRFSPDVIDAFRATGKGWQTRMNDALIDWLKTHTLPTKNG